MALIERYALFVLKAIRFVAAVWVIACFIVMCISVWAQVGGRYVFNYSIAWSEELATISQIWMVLVGAGIAARHGMHAKIDVLLTRFPKPAQRVLTLATLALGLSFLASIVLGAQPMIRLGEFQTSPALGLPMSIPYLALVVGPIYFGVELIAATARYWTGDAEANAPAVEHDAL